MIYAAFILGLIGNIHCAGMCGPIAFALPVHHLPSRQRLLASVLYNAGRVVTYMALGLVFGIIGSGFNLTGLQEWLTIISGMVLILMVTLPFGLKGGGKLATWYHSITLPLKSKMGVLLKTGNVNTLFLFGMLNGLLPCGMVYAGLAVALSAGSIVESILIMAAFGLGTTPALALIIYQSGVLKRNIGKHLKFVIPFSVFILGSILILRGLSLDIPYVSPVLNANIVEAESHSCH